MVQNNAPELYAARVASRAEARERELSLRQSLPQLLLYTLGSKCEFASGFVLTLRLREAAHMWLVVKLLTSGERKLGVLLGPEVAGTDGRMATVCNLPFCNPIPLAKAVSRVMWEKKSQGYVSLRLRIGADHFRAVFVSHALEASEHQAWRQLASVADTLSGVVPTPLPAARHANAPRLASAHVVMAPRAAGLRTAVNVAIASAHIWCAKACSSPRTSEVDDDFSYGDTLSDASEATDRFGPYWDLRDQKLPALRAWLSLCADGSKDGPSRTVDLTDPSGSTALHYAVLAPYVVAVDLLLRAGANVNARNQTGSTPLLLATIKAHHSLVVMLLREGAQPDLPDRDGHTPLMVASRAGWTETVKALLDANAASEAVDTHNHTALWYAQKFEQKGCIVLLKKCKKATKSSRAKR